MAKCVWTLLCAKASIDRESNNISLFDIFDRINLAGVPKDTKIIVPLQSDLAILWARSDYSQPESAICRFKLVTQAETVMGTGQFEVNLSESNIRARQIIHLNSLPVQGPGVYNFVIEVQDPEDGNWKRAFELPLEVNYE